MTLKFAHPAIVVDACWNGRVACVLSLSELITKRTTPRVSNSLGRRCRLTSNSAQRGQNPAYQGDNYHFLFAQVVRKRHLAARQRVRQSERFNLGARLESFAPLLSVIVEDAQKPNATRAKTASPSIDALTTNILQYL